jgi:hypothetical protein
MGSLTGHRSGYGMAEAAVSGDHMPRWPFRDWDAWPTSAYRICLSELSGTMYAICG